MSHSQGAPLPLGPAFAAPIPALTYAAAASPVIETKIEAAEAVEVPAVEAVEAPTVKTIEIPEVKPLEIPTLKTIELPAIETPTLKTLLPTINAAPIALAAAPAIHPIHPFASPITYAASVGQPLLAASPVIETKIEAAEAVEVPAVEAVEAPKPVEIPTLKAIEIPEVKPLEIPALKTIELPAINAPLAYAAAPAFNPIHSFASPITYNTGHVLAASPAITTYTSGPILATTAVKTTVEAIEAPKAEVVEVAEA